MYLNTRLIEKKKRVRAEKDSEFEITQLKCYAVTQTHIQIKSELK